MNRIKASLAQVVTITHSISIMVASKLSSRNIIQFRPVPDFHTHWPISIQPIVMINFDPSVVTCQEDCRREERGGAR